MMAQKINPKQAYWMLIAAISEATFGVSYVVINIFYEMPYFSLIIAITLISSSAMFVILAIRLHNQEKAFR
ncbi:MAG: hypothetical protein Q8Q69_05745 [Nitrosopumilaceae archaeon]|nr:hypothetical protein [Nitrosopumilaceae archaeon]